MRLLRNFLGVLAIICSYCLLSSCGKVSTEPEFDFTYPLQVGDSWQYTGVDYRYNYRPIGGPPQTNIDTICSLNCRISIAGLDTIYDSLEVYVFQDSTTYIYFNTGIDSIYIAIGTELFNNEDDGFYNYAYSPGGSYIAMPNLSPGSFFEQMDNHLPPGKIQTSGLPNTLVFEDPPLKCLPYPLTMNAQWIYRQPRNPWAVSKKITGHQEISTPAGVFGCLVIEWLYDIDDNGIWDTNIQKVDYIAEQGLIKRSITYLDVILVDELGNILGYYDSKTEIELVGYAG